MKQPRSGHSDAGAWPPGAVPEDTSRTLYFARVPPTVPSEEILALFKTCGPVRNLQLYRPWRKARSSKGCGLVEYQDANGAQAALERLNGTTYWPNAFSPLLVEPLAPHKVHNRPQRHKTSRHHLQQGMQPLPPPTTLTTPAAAPGAMLPPAVALACSAGGVSTMGGNLPSLTRSSSTSSSASSSSNGGGCSPKGTEAQQAAQDPTAKQGYVLHSLFLPATGSDALGNPVLAACHHLRAGSRSSSASWVFPAPSSSTADDTDVGCTSSTNNSSSSNAFVAPVVPGAPAPMLLGSGLGLPLGQGNSSGEEVYLSSWCPSNSRAGGAAKGHGATGAPVTSDAAVLVPLVGLPLVCPSPGDVCISSSMGPAAGCSLGMEAPALHDIQQQLAALSGQWGAPPVAASSGVTAPALATHLSASLGMESVGFAAPVLAAEGLGAISSQLAPAPAPTLPARLLTLAGKPATSEPAPVALGDAVGSPVGHVSLPCQQRVQVRVSLAKAVALAHHAPSLAQITGASVSFAATTDGDAVLTLEGSIAQVVQAQNLSLLLLL